MSRILVIGGYGGFGGRLSRRLQLAGHQVIVGGRDAAKAARFCADLPNAEPAQVDRNAELGPLLGQLQPALVIDAAGPFQGSSYAVAEACIAAGISYLDLADGRDFVVGIDALDKAASDAGVVVISGASTLPALSAAVVRHLAKTMDRLDQVRIALSASTKSTANASVVTAILGYVGKPVRVRRAGVWSQAVGWQGIRRETYAIEGIRPLKRWVALADVPDLELIPAMVPGQPSMEFRAGTDVSYHMVGLWLTSWLVRWRLIPSLAPASRWLLRLQRATAFARGDRSAMQVVLRGLRHRRGFECKWTLLADNFHGPEIPTMAVALLASDITSGKIAPGARDASLALALHRFEQSFAALDIKHEVTEQITPALYENALGDRFARLPEAVRSMHEVYGDGGAAGDGNVTIPGGPLGRLICRLMRFPPQGSYPVHVAFAERDAVETWTRNFGGYRFRSRLKLRRGRLSERFGPLRFTFDLSSDADGLRMILRGWDVFGVPLPMALAPRIEASEWEEAGWFRFSVAVALPGIGPLVRYSGRLKRLCGERIEERKNERAAG